MAFLRHEAGKGFVSVLPASTSVYISVCVCVAARLHMFSHPCVSFVDVFATVSVCAGEAEFQSNICIQTPSLYSTLLAMHRPQLSLFPVHPERSYSWPKTHQVGRTTDN